MQHILGVSLYPSIAAHLDTLQTRVKPRPANRSALVRALVRVGMLSGAGIDAARGKRSGERAGMLNFAVDGTDFARIEALGGPHGLNRSKTVAALIESMYGHFYPDETLI